MLRPDAAPRAAQCGPLSRVFYERDPRAVAHDLLGKLLFAEGDSLCVGRIVETEAYLARRDPACHGHRGRTPRNASMFGRPGLAYVYAIHSRWCLNAVTEPEGVASAVLIRAVEPLSGHDAMGERRGTTDELVLTRGPGRLCQAFAIDRGLDGHDLTLGQRLWIAEDRNAPVGAKSVLVTQRIGVTKAKSRRLRYCVRGNHFVSGLRSWRE